VLVAGRVLGNNSITHYDCRYAMEVPPSFLETE
jgi:hypothetical protein